MKDKTHIMPITNSESEQKMKHYANCSECKYCVLIFGDLTCFPEQANTYIWSDTWGKWKIWPQSFVILSLDSLMNGGCKTSSEMQPLLFVFWLQAIGQGYFLGVFYSAWYIRGGKIFFKTNYPQEFYRARFSSCNCQRILKSMFWILGYLLLLEWSPM